MNGSSTARILSRLWFLVIAVVAIAILFLAKVLFLPLAFAILFAFLLAPVVSLLERLRLPRALAAVLVILGFAALLGTAGWMLFTQLVAVTNDLPTYRDNITQKMEAIHSPSDSAFLARAAGGGTAQRGTGPGKFLRSTPLSVAEVRATSSWARRRNGRCRCAKWRGPPADWISWAESWNR